MSISDLRCPRGARWQFRILPQLAKAAMRRVRAGMQEGGPASSAGVAWDERRQQDFAASALEDPCGRV